MYYNVMIKDLIESWLIRHDRAFKNQYRPGPIYEIRCPARVNVSHTASINSASAGPQLWSFVH